VRTLDRARAAIGRLPHAGPARFVRTVRAVTDGAIETEGGIPDRCAWIVGGRVPAYVVLEFAAQSAAVFEIADAPDRETSETAERGFVVRARDLRCLRRDFPSDARLRARVDLEGAAAPLAMYRFEVRANGEPIADGAFSTFVERSD
jgi:predicted hotdog family 3-hydroxylacyl-ACP dehydratase